jgi:hypothetical protein
VSLHGRLLPSKGVRDSHTTWTGFWGAHQGDRKAFFTIGYGAKGEGAIDCWDLATGKQTGTRKLGEYVGSYLEVSPRGDAVAVRVGASEITLWRGDDLLPRPKEE